MVEMTAFMVAWLATTAFVLVAACLILWSSQRLQVPSPNPPVAPRARVTVGKPIGGWK